jgi:hypothetical protein
MGVSGWTLVKYSALSRPDEEKRIIMKIMRAVVR